MDKNDPHVLPTEPAWLTRLANATGTHSMSAFEAAVIAKYVRGLREAAWRSRLREEWRGFEVRIRERHCGRFRDVSRVLDSMAKVEHAEV